MMGGWEYDGSEEAHEEEEESVNMRILLFLPFLLFLLAISMPAVVSERKPAFRCERQRWSKRAGKKPAKAKQQSPPSNQSVKNKQKAPGSRSHGPSEKKGKSKQKSFSKAASDKAKEAVQKKKPPTPEQQEKKLHFSFHRNG